MTTFRVLPIQDGDGYLLRSNRGGYLLDGGNFGADPVKMLRERKVRKIRVAVCTSEVPGKLGGILELMASGYPVSEFWLPETLELLPEMARHFSADIDVWRKLVGSGAEKCEPFLWTAFGGPCADDSHRRLLGAAACLALGVSCLPGQGGGDVVHESLESLVLHMLEILSRRVERDSASLLYHGVAQDAGFSRRIEEQIVLCGRLLLEETESSMGKQGAGMVGRGLAMAALAAVFSSHASAKLRYFRRLDRQKDELVPYHPLRCLNGMEVNPRDENVAEAEPESLELLAARMGKGQDGLVFQYADYHCSVLFCGEGRMSFLKRGQSLCLDRPSVVVAPSKGSCVADRAYEHIVSLNTEQDVWVRGFLPSSLKISPYYKNRYRRLCLNNCMTNTLHEVYLSFDDGVWNVNSGGCCQETPE